MNKVALITGITGQDGSFLAEFLLEKGYDKATGKCLVEVSEDFYRKHSKKCTFYTLRFGCSFAAVNTIKPQLL